MTRLPSESEDRSTTELDPAALRGLLDTEERKPTTLMNRDELLELVNATAATPSSSNVVPRALLEQRGKLASAETEVIDEDIIVGRGISPLIVLAIIGVLIGMFVAIVATAH